MGEHLRGVQTAESQDEEIVGRNQHYVFILGSARREGNTETLARVAASGLSEQTDQTWLRLLDLPLSPFQDVRHSGGVYDEPAGNEKVLLDATLAATDLVFVSPVYWYALPARTKEYLDFWSKWMRVEGRRYKQRMEGKTMWSIHMISSDDFVEAQPSIDSLQMTATYMKMHWGGSLIGKGNQPGDITKDQEALTKAATLFSKTQY